MPHRHATGEAALWHAVVAQAFHDAAPRRRPARPLSAERARARDAARCWLLEDGRDFRRVCDLAGLDARAVRAEAVEAIRAADERMSPTAPPRCSMPAAAAA